MLGNLQVCSQFYALLKSTLHLFMLILNLLAEFQRITLLSTMAGALNGPWKQASASVPRLVRVPCLRKFVWRRDFQSVSNKTWWPLYKTPLVYFSVTSNHVSTILIDCWPSRLSAIQSNRCFHTFQRKWTHLLHKLFHCFSQPVKLSSAPRLLYEYSLICKGRKKKFYRLWAIHKDAYFIWTSWLCYPANLWSHQNIKVR